MAAIKMLSIEIDGHFHGSPRVPQPWVAKITGPCPKFGLGREFVQRLNDWKDAKQAWSGNLYGVVAHFPLRDGCLYEVSRLRGNSSKRSVSREFVSVESGKLRRLGTMDALERVVGPGVPFATEDPVDKSELERAWVARVTGLGTPIRQGFVARDGQRVYLLRDGLYEVSRAGSRSFLGVSDGCTVAIASDEEAESWLRNKKH